VKELEDLMIFMVMNHKSIMVMVDTRDGKREPNPFAKEKGCGPIFHFSQFLLPII
jgi:hypothetical protein